MPGSSDHIFRENVAPVFEVFVREVLGVRPISSERVELSQPKTSERKPDYLRKVVLEPGTPPVILHIEFQTEVDPLMHLRMLEYNALLRRRFGLAMQQFVVLLSGSGDSMPTEINETDLWFRYTLVRMQDIRVDTLLESGVPELIVAAVLADFKRKDAIGVIRRILVTLRQRVPSQRDLHKYLTQLEILSHIRSYNTIVIEEVDKMAFTYNLETDGRYKQGVEHSKERIARESLKNGVSVELTAKITGLPLKAVKEIKASLSSPAQV